jgi:hypothetical protein
MTKRWDDLKDDVGYTIGCLEQREFLIIRYLTATDPTPYAQVAVEPDGTYYCEVVSAHQLPAITWPIAEHTLIANGWEGPAGRQTNWSCTAQSAAAAGCPDPERFVGTIDRWPPPPDNEGDHVPILPKGPFGLAA